MEALKNLCNELIKTLSPQGIDIILNLILSRKEIQDFIIGLNQDQLHKEQIDSEGKVLPFYTPNSYQLKVNKFGAGYPKRFTLLDTGAFYDSMKLYLKQEYFMVRGDTKKPNKDLFSYSPDIMGLTEENIVKLQRKIQPLLIQELTK